ncbi:hypothetical protein BCL90_5170 [Pedobacter alluvionis]|uniref:Uncharacterized protein n=1 Tax=Pedobacter alluvionis TaxID=475253 RepID=A0A497XLF4_9SPHI|nr:hypothetical protein BCL90_5170 [Pedobacter alluvionis]
MQPDHIESSYQEDLRYNPYLLRTSCVTVLLGLIIYALITWLSMSLLKLNG